MVLTWYEVGLLPLWTLIDYMQWISLLPLLKIRYFPDAIDTFKPALITNFVIYDNSLMLAEEEVFPSDLSRSYENYEMPFPSLAKLIWIVVVPIALLSCLCISKHACSLEHRIRYKANDEFRERATDLYYNIFYRTSMILFMPMTFFASMNVM